MAQSKFKLMTLCLAVPPCKHNDLEMSSDVQNACFQTMLLKSHLQLMGQKVLAAEYFITLLLHLEHSDPGLRGDVVFFSLQMSW